MPGAPGLDEALAGRLARVALDNVAREYPNKLDHLMASAADVAGPSALHPVFYGSYDWHSSVHMHWTLVTLLARFPDLPEAEATVERLDAHFTEARVAGELAYLARPSSSSFERPYGWAWLLKLSHALHGLAAHDARAIAWRDRLQPLADVFVERTLAFLPRAVHPSRAGSHANSAFAVTLMLDYATRVEAREFTELLAASVSLWFGADRDYPVAYELSSEDFLSNGLLEAVAMRRALRLVDGPGADARFSDWWHAFVPDVARLTPWLTPVVPSDRGDARLTHIDGLNLSRAWCWAELEDAMPQALRMPVRRAIDAHRAESLPHAAAGHYVGTHWLASFALLALGL
jgi:Protein of unknown function (DUF2891)